MITLKTMTVMSQPLLDSLTDFDENPLRSAVCSPFLALRQNIIDQQVHNL